MKLFKYSLFVVCAAAASSSNADQIRADDMVVQGNLCIGVDCVNDEDFSNRVLKLKENNLRIRWYDLTATAGGPVRQTFDGTYVDGEVGESWRLDANQSSNGGDNGIYISQMSVVDYPVYSDGSAPDYDCSDPFVNPNPVVGTIPVDEPAEAQSDCGPYRNFVQLNVLAIDGLVDVDDNKIGGVALGIGSEIANGEVSLGNADLKRRLVHVARAIADSDVLIKEQLDQGLFQAQQIRLNEIEALITMAENELEVLEQEVSTSGSSGGGGSNGSSGSGGGGAAGWLLLLLPLAALKFRNRKTLA